LKTGRFRIVHCQHCRELGAAEKQGGADIGEAAVQGVGVAVKSCLRVRCPLRAIYPQTIGRTLLLRLRCNPADSGNIIPIDELNSMFDGIPDQYAFIEIPQHNQISIIHFLRPILSTFPCQPLCHHLHHITDPYKEANDA
jgi:hypothetical protein